MKVVSKRNVILILTIVAVIFILVIVIIKKNITEEKEIMQEEKNIVTNNSALTMMYETSLGSGEYEVVSETTWPQEGYVFNEELSRCENGSILSWDDTAKRVIMEANTKDKCYVYFDVYEPTLADLCTGKTLASCITENVYTSDGVNDLYYHDGVGSYTNASEEAGDNSYRYSGANPDNYVCFGSDEATCPTDNLYRIIGVFDGQVKLIKATNYGNYAWFASGNLIGQWSRTEIRTTLNDAYYNSLGTEWQNLIENTTWQVGGNTYGNIADVPIKSAYNNEVGMYNTGITDTMNVGLMYVSDYGYAASPDAWITILYEYNSSTIRDNNWLYEQENEWTISSYSAGMITPFIIYGGGIISSNGSYSYGTRPTFYLESNVSYVSGTGTITDPFKIKLS